MQLSETQKEQVIDYYISSGDIPIGLSFLSAQQRAEIKAKVLSLKQYTEDFNIFIDNQIQDQWPQYIVSENKGVYVKNFLAFKNKDKLLTQYYSWSHLKTNYTTTQEVFQAYVKKHGLHVGERGVIENDDMKTCFQYQADRDMMVLMQRCDSID